MRSKHAITGSAGTVKTLFEGLLSYGISVTTIEEITGLDHRNLLEPDARVPIEKVLKLAHKIRELTGIPAIGLKLGTDPKVIYPSGVGWGILSNAATLIDGIRQFARFTRIFSEFLVIDLLQENNRTIILFRTEPMEYYTSFSMEVVLSRFLTTLRSITGKDMVPLEVHFHHPKPDYADAYHRLFGREVVFEQPTCRLVLASEMLEVQITHRDPYLATLLTKHAEKLLSELSSTTSFSSQVKNIIVRQLVSGQVDVEMVSEALNISRSTLFRKLREEGLTFKEILQDTRRELALHYLKQKNLTVSEIAFMLGFSEPSTFNRAFKNWENQSPHQYRLNMGRC